MPRNPSGPMPGSPSRCYPSIVHVLDETVQNVGSCERMLGLKVGVSKRQMADRLPVGELASYTSANREPRSSPAHGPGRRR